LLVAVLVRVVDVSSLLKLRVEPPVVDAKRNQVDFLAINAAILDTLVLILDVVGELRTVVATVRLIIVSDREHDIEL
jgi:hypothetical protein